MPDPVAVEDSILNSTKKNLGIAAEDHAFDHDVLTNINNAFFTLAQLGVGPLDGFEIEDESDVWDDFDEPSRTRNAVKTYIYLKTRSIFDPPGTPHHLTAIKDQITELEHRLKTEKVISRPALATPPGL